MQSAKNNKLLMERMVTVGSSPNLNLIWSLIYPTN